MTFNADVQSILRFVEQAPVPVGWAFDPVALVRAVNGLQTLGAEHATELLRDYVRTTEQRRAPDADTRRVSLILRLLFVPVAPEKSLPSLSLGNPDVTLPRGDPAWPYLPLALSKDLPFLLVGNYVIGGGMRSALYTIDEYATQGQLRSALLQPLEPVGAVEALINSQEWQRLLPAEHRARVAAMLYTQVVRTVRDVYPTNEADYQALAVATTQELATQWESHKAAIQALDLRWNVQQQAFLPASG